MILGTCKKKVSQIDYPKEHYCEKFAGKYDMYDPQNDEHYEMVCTCLLEENENNDTIQFYNYANRFDFKYLVSYTGDSKPINLPGIIISPIVDHYGSHTSLSMMVSSYYPPQNILRNDSLYIAFTINNWAYYASDGVPWEVCEDCLHYGVKVH